MQSLGRFDMASSPFFTMTIGRGFAYVGSF
jgi:hypothetical protein